jgi:LemA protein
MLGTIIAIVVVAIVVIWAVVQYNGLVARRNTVDESFGQIETQLQRRFDLIPNLVATAKEYAAHEVKVFESVTEARAEAGRAAATGSTEGVAKADRLLHDAAMEINAVAEAYPDLKASANFGQLQEELASTENKVAFSRQAYNDSVNDYNTKRESFPSNILAKIFKFTARDMFTVEDPAARRAVRVDFS